MIQSLLKITDEQRSRDGQVSPFICPQGFSLICHRRSEASWSLESPTLNGQLMTDLGQKTAISLITGMTGKQTEARKAPAMARHR
jgi:hypothetical protein